MDSEVEVNLEEIPEDHHTDITTDMKLTENKEVTERIIQQELQLIIENSDQPKMKNLNKIIIKEEVKEKQEVHIKVILIKLVSEVIKEETRAVMKEEAKNRKILIEESETNNPIETTEKIEELEVLKETMKKIVIDLCLFHQ